MGMIFLDFKTGEIYHVLHWNIMPLRETMKDNISEEQDRKATPGKQWNLQFHILSVCSWKNLVCCLLCLINKTSFLPNIDYILDWILGWFSFGRGAGFTAVTCLEVVSCLGSWSAWKWPWVSTSDLKFRLEAMIPRFMEWGNVCCEVVSSLWPWKLYVKEKYYLI